MASGLVDTEAARLLASSLNGTAYPNTTGTYVALHTAAGSRTATGTEVSGGSYGRQGPAAFTVSGATATNASAINFTGMPAATVVALSFWDAVNGGNRRWFGDLTAARTTAAGDTISFSPSAISVALAPT